MHLTRESKIPTPIFDRVMNLPKTKGFLISTSVVSAVETDLVAKIDEIESALQSILGDLYVPALTSEESVDTLRHLYLEHFKLPILGYEDDGTPSVSARIIEGYMSFRMNFSESAQGFIEAIWKLSSYSSRLHVIRAIKTYGVLNDAATTYQVTSDHLKELDSFAFSSTIFEFDRRGFIDIPEGYRRISLDYKFPLQWLLFQLLDEKLRSYNGSTDPYLTFLSKQFGIEAEPRQRRVAKTVYFSLLMTPDESFRNTYVTSTDQILFKELTEKFGFLINDSEFLLSLLSDRVSLFGSPLPTEDADEFPYNVTDLYLLLKTSFNELLVHAISEVETFVASENISADAFDLAYLFGHEPVFFVREDLCDNEFLSKIGEIATIRFENFTPTSPVVADFSYAS